MKILFIHTYYKLKGGEDNVVANEIELLRAAGMEVEQLTFSNSGSTLLNLLQLPFNFRSYRKTSRKIQEFKPDVVHIHNLHFAGSASVVYAIKKRHLPIVMTLHNYRLLCPSASLYHDNQLFIDSLKKGFAWQAVRKGVYQNSRLITFWLACSMYLHEQLDTWNKIDRFIVLGEHAREIFANSKFHRLADKLVVKPNFCFSPEESGLKETGMPVTPVANVPYYLYVGRLTEEKGVPVLLEAFAASGHALEIVGTGPMEALVLDYCIRYPNISFTGVRSTTEVSELLRGAKALIFPSVWYETFGMVVIEAFAAGTPVIASDLGNIRNLVAEGRGGLLFRAGDAADLSRKIAHFEQLTPALRADYGKQARQEYLRQYSPEANLIQLSALYKMLLQVRFDPQVGGN